MQCRILFLKTGDECRQDFQTLKIFWPNPPDNKTRRNLFHQLWQYCFQYNYAGEILQKLGDKKQLAALYIESQQWEEVHWSFFYSNMFGLKTWSKLAEDTSDQRLRKYVSLNVPFLYMFFSRFLLVRFFSLNRFRKKCLISSSSFRGKSLHHTIYLSLRNKF